MFAARLYLASTAQCKVRSMLCRSTGIRIAGRRSISMQFGDEDQSVKPGLPHSTVLGRTTQSIIAYNCNYDNNPQEDSEQMDESSDANPSLNYPYQNVSYTYDKRRHIQFCGSKWQCVEFARRYWISSFDLKLPHVEFASELMTISHATRLEDLSTVALRKFTNKSTTTKPQAGDLLIYAQTKELPVGHVAVITDITNENHALIAEQNFHNDQLWDGNYARQLQIHSKNGNYAFDEPSILGFVRPDWSAVTPASYCPPSSFLLENGEYDSATIQRFNQFLGIQNCDRHTHDTDIALSIFLNTFPFKPQSNQFSFSDVSPSGSSLLLEEPHLFHPAVLFPSVRQLEFQSDQQKQALVSLISAFQRQLLHLNEILSQSTLVAVNRNSKFDLKSIQIGQWCPITTFLVQRLLNCATSVDQLQLLCALSIRN